MSTGASVGLRQPLLCIFVHFLFVYIVNREVSLVTYSKAYKHGLGHVNVNNNGAGRHQKKIMQTATAAAPMNIAAASSLAVDPMQTRVERCRIVPKSLAGISQWPIRSRSAADRYQRNPKGTLAKSRSAKSDSTVALYVLGCSTHPRNEKFTDNI